MGLKEMPYAPFTAAIIYYDKSAGSATINRCTMSNCCAFKAKQDFEGNYLTLMHGKSCGSCKWSMYVCQTKCLGCCCNCCCCGCSAKGPNKDRREELRKIFGEDA